MASEMSQPVQGVAEPTGPRDEAEQAEWEKHRAAQVREYEQFEATADIWHGGALAYAAGHPVPASNVERHGYEEQGLVRRVKE